jgi:hypothetical protein
MVLKIEAEAALVAIDCIDQATGKSRGCGTAFWADLSGGPKLITAKHLAWPPCSTPPIPVTNGEVISVNWKTVAGQQGHGDAEFHTHPTDPSLDYVTIHFCDAKNAPPKLTLTVATATPAVAAQLIVLGFPGPFAATTSPTPGSAVGVVEKINLSRQILVSGSATGGYSGGPAFDYVDDQNVGDFVVGLMSGQPDAAVLNQACLSDGFVLVEAIAFA